MGNGVYGAARALYDGPTDVSMLNLPVSAPINGAMDETEERIEQAHEHHRADATAPVRPSAGAAHVVAVEAR